MKGGIAWEVILVAEDGKKELIMSDGTSPRVHTMLQVVAEYALLDKRRLGLVRLRLGGWTRSKHKRHKYPL